MFLQALKAPLNAALADGVFRVIPSSFSVNRNRIESLVLGRSLGRTFSYTIY